VKGKTFAPFVFSSHRSPLTAHMTLKSRINDDVKAAMRGGDARRRDALRLLLAAVKQREVDERRELTDADVVSVVERMIKQRRESIAHFEKGGRQDLAQSEQYEIGLLQGYMPQALSDAEIAAAVAEAISATGATAPADMGKVMGVLKGKLAGKADMSKVSALVKTKLAG
jgi:hypothetical protein